MNEDMTYTVHDNMRSPGYVRVISWLSDIWARFPEHKLINSFEFCGITSLSYHTVLKEMLNNNSNINEYLDICYEHDFNDGFNDENLFDQGKYLNKKMTKGK